MRSQILQYSRQGSRALDAENAHEYWGHHHEHEGRAHPALLLCMPNRLGTRNGEVDDEKGRQDRPLLIWGIININVVLKLQQYNAPGVMQGVARAQHDPAQTTTR